MTIEIPATLAIEPADLAAAVKTVLAETAAVPEPSSLPPRQPVKGPLVIENEPYGITRDIDVAGGIVIAPSSPGHRLINVTARDAGPGIWNGVSVRAPGVMLVDVSAINNGAVNERGKDVGHGIWLNDNVDGFLAYGVRTAGNIEDGVQAGNDATGTMTFMASEFASFVRSDGKGENVACDVKGGRVVLVNCDIVAMKGAGRHEPLLIHNNGHALEVYETRIRVETSKAILNLSAGTALFHRCTFDVSHDGWWNLDDGRRHPPLLDGINGALTCIECVRV